MAVFLFSETGISNKGIGYERIRNACILEYYSYMYMCLKNRHEGI